MASLWLRLSVLIFVIGCGAPGFRQAADSLTSAQREQLVATAQSFIGAPYKYGGHTIEGFDCSGLIRAVYGQVLGVELPRTVRGIYYATVEVGSGRVLPGDLVFFRISGGDIDHIGLILDKHQFLHAAEANGVIISSFDDEYYRRRIFCVKRAN